MFSDKQSLILSRQDEFTLRDLIQQEQQKHRFPDFSTTSLNSQRLRTQHSKLQADKWGPSVSQEWNVLQHKFQEALREHFMWHTCLQPVRIWLPSPVAYPQFETHITEQGYVCCFTKQTSCAPFDSCRLRTGYLIAETQADLDRFCKESSACHGSTTQ